LRKILMKKVLLASVLAIASFPGYTAEEFDWGKYCGSGNKYCDPSDSEDNNWTPPSKAELQACSENGRLDYACLRMRNGIEEETSARVTVAPPYQGPPPIGWVYGPYTMCGDPPRCSMGVVNVQADGLNVRVVPNGPPVMSLVNGC
jgi:hypothetical protein